MVSGELFWPLYAALRHTTVNGQLRALYIAQRRHKARFPYLFMWEGYALILSWQTYQWWILTSRNLHLLECNYLAIAGN